MGKFESFDLIVNEFLQNFGAHEFLGALLILLLGAMVINVVEDCRLFHFFNPRFALGTSIFALVSKFIFTLRANELMFFFCGYHPAALAAFNLPRVGKMVVGVRSWLSFPAELHLDTVKVILGNHGCMRAFDEIALTCFFVLYSKVAVVKRLGENFINCGDGKMPTALPFCLPCF